MPKSGLRLDISVGNAKRRLAKALEEMQAQANRPIKAKLQIDTSSAKRAEAEVDRLRKKLNQPLLENVKRGPAANGQQEKWSAKKQIADVDSMVTALNKAKAKLDRKEKSFSGLISKRDLLGDGSVMAELSKVETTVSKAEEMYARLEKKKKNGLPMTDSDLKDFGQVMAEMDKVYASVDAAQARIAKSMDFNELDASLSKIQEKISKIKADYGDFSQRTKGAAGEPQVENLSRKIKALEEYDAKIKAYRESLASSGNDLSQTDALGMESTAKRTKRAIDEIESDMHRLKNSLSPAELESKNMRTFDKLGNRMTAYYKQYESQILKNAEIHDKWRSIVTKLNTGQYASSKEANNAFASFRMEARRAGVEVDTLGAKLERTFGARLRSALAGEGVFMMQSALRDIVQNAIEVDTAMTELKKVTDLSDSGYTEFLSDAGDRAGKLGATLTEVVNSTADYARLGFDVPAATELADSAIIYKNVGDGLASIDDATSSLISTMQGFSLASNDSMRIVDRFNEVANRFPVSAADIGEMIKRSASSMAAANNDLDETIALGVAANSVVQDADVVGRKTCLAT